MRAVLLLPLLGGCALFKLAAVDKSHPDLEGDLAVPGLSAPVQIVRDELGVPHIRGETELDALTGLGFAHAQDRLFQADLRRKIAWGELSEWLGEDVAELDLFVQGLELRKHARRSFEALSPQARAVVEAYTRGFNAGALTLPAPPIEYRLLGAEFEPWQPEDLYSTVYLQSWGLAENAPHEALALVLRDDFDGELADRLLRLSGEGEPTEADWDRLRKTDIADFSKGYRAWTSAMGGMPKTAEASNNWVIGPARSADGAPMVANDPHLGQSVPSLWYVADVRGGDTHAAGVTLAGVPVVVIGHNERVAWGLTNVMTDSVDLAVLRRDGENGVIVAGEREELRPVKTEAAGREGVVYHCSLGPVVSELDAEQVVVLRWHALGMAESSVDAFLEVNRASSVEEVLSSFRGRSMAIAQNLVVGDVDGDFAWQQVGSVVERKPGVSGRVPHDGSSEGVAWTGFREDLPGERAPERGYIHTANSRPSDPRADFGAFYVPPWRHDRIEELIEEREELTVEDMTRIQNDVVENTARALLPELLVGVEGSSEESRRCAELLGDWDHVMRADAEAPSAWTLFMRELLRELVAEDLGAEGAAAYLSVASSGRNLFGRADPSPPEASLDSRWARFGVQSVDRETAVDRSLGAACTELSAREDASWGAVHPLQLNHPFAAGRKLLAGWNMDPVPWPGNGSTVAAAGHGFEGPLMPVGGMVSMRLVMPLADLGASTLVHPGGQSGQPGHPLYETHYDSFTAGGTEPLWFDDEDVKREGRWTLVLQPE